MRRRVTGSFAPRLLPILRSSLYLDPHIGRLNGADATRAAAPLDEPRSPSREVAALPAGSDAPAPVRGDEPGPELAQGALVLYAKVLGATSLIGAAHRLVGALVDDFGYDRASIGLHENGRTVLLASSNLDPSGARSEFRQQLLGPMDEAIEQGVSLAWPVAPASSGASPDWIRLEHEMLQRQLGGVIATVPLGVGGEVFGAVCVQRHEGPPIDADELHRLEQVLMLAAPALRWMQHGTQPWHRRAWRDLALMGAALRQPGRRTTRRAIAAAALALAFLAIVPLEHDVGGRAHVEGAEQRVLVAPTDGFVKAAHVRPGDRVRAGDAVVDLVEGDLRLERERWSSQLAQHENAYAAAMAKSDRVVASTSMARIGEAEAQMALVDEQLARGRITAPFDAMVIQGDLSQSIGAPVRQGDTLVTLATTGHHRVIVEIDEVDIARVQPGQQGWVTLSSLAWDRQDLVVERITPLARAVDGRNVFEVQARLLSPRSDLRPGLLGRAGFAVGRLPLLWGWSQRALDRIRIAYWSWLG